MLHGPQSRVDPLPRGGRMHGWARDELHLQRPEHAEISPSMPSEANFPANEFPDRREIVRAFIARIRRSKAKLVLCVDHLETRHIHRAKATHLYQPLSR